MVASIDHLASSAGLEILRRGGSAVDAAIATNAVLAVTSQHTCGLGGDLFAIVHPGGTQTPKVLNASGRSGSGADANELRSEGHRQMPFRQDLRSVTVPGCVDGWVQLHETYGRLGLEEVLAPAIGYAQDGFPVSPTLAEAIPDVRDVPGAEDFLGPGRAPLAEGQILRRPVVGRLLQDIADGGRQAWYGGEFAERLLQMSAGLFTEADLTADHAGWVSPAVIDAWGHQIWTVPPNSQGYLTLAALAIMDDLAVSDQVEDPVFVHHLIEASKQLGAARPAELHEHADASTLLAPERLERIRRTITAHASEIDPGSRRGDTTYLCAVDDEGLAVSLIQSNAAGFGAHLVVPGTGVFLHNRGLGFSLELGHPAELRPCTRPPHTLAPAMITRADGQLHSVLGTMGGDRQPQIVAQLAAALLLQNDQPGQAVTRGRWGISTGDRRPGFGAWDAAAGPVVDIEGHAPTRWDRPLEQRGHRVRRGAAFDSDFGHAHVITALGGVLAGAADPRALNGAVVGR